MDATYQSEGKQGAEFRYMDRHNSVIKSHDIREGQDVLAHGLTTHRISTGTTEVDP